MSSVMCFRGLNPPLRSALASACCSPPDKSGILHEVYQPRPQLKEDAVQEAEWGVWSQNQCSDKVSTLLLHCKTQLPDCKP